MKRLVTTLVVIVAIGVLLVLTAFAGLQATGHLTAPAIVSGSMDVPGGIPIGATALGWRVDSVGVDDVVTAHLPDGRQVTHRVIEVLPDGAFRMQGDANDQPDSPVYRVAGGVARVFAVVPSMGRIAVGVRDNRMAMLGITLACGMLLGHALPHHRSRRRAHASDSPPRRRADASRSRARCRTDAPARSGRHALRT